MTSSAPSDVTSDAARSGAAASADPLLERLRVLDSTVVSDALDSLNLPAGLGGLRPAWGSPRFAGRARTVALEPHDGGPAGPHLGTSVVADAQPGDVVVMANDGRLDVSCWGGLLSLGCTQRGIAGVIADGACRDVAEAEELGLPVFARGVSPRTARGRLRQRATGVPVVVGDVTVNDGDLVIADGSGVVFVPAVRADDVLRAAEATVAREAAISADIRSGARIDEAMHDARLAGRQTRQQDGQQDGQQGRTAGTDRGRTMTAHTSGDFNQTRGLAGLPTASISDALDRLGLPGSVHGISPLRPGQPVCGPAFTVTYEPVDENGGTVGDFLDDVPPGAVVFIDNQGKTDCTVWGGIMTGVAAHRGVAATVIHGVCRDVAVTDTTSYRIWSSGRFMRTGKDRVRVRAVQEPLLVDGVTIRPGDVVCADEDGIVVVPAGRAAEVADVAARIEAVEDAIVTAVRDGSTLAEARGELGYHALQTRQDDSEGAPA